MCGLQLVFVFQLRETLQAQAEQQQKLAQDPEYQKAQVQAMSGNAAALEKIREKQKKDLTKLFAAAGAFHCPTVDWSVKLKLNNSRTCDTCLLTLLCFLI
jgi:hypothetical protein